MPPALVARCIHTRGDPGGRSPPVLIQGWPPPWPPPLSASMAPLPLLPPPAPAVRGDSWDCPARPLGVRASPATRGPVARRRRRRHPPEAWHRRDPLGPRRGDCPSGACRCPETLGESGWRQAPLPPPAPLALVPCRMSPRGCLAGAGLHGHLACGTVSSVTPREPQTRIFFFSSLPLPHWLTRQCGARSHGSEGAAARRPPPPRARRQRGAEGPGGREARWVPGGGSRHSRAGASVGAPPRRSTKTTLTRAPAALWKKYDRTAGPWLAWCCCSCLAGLLAACLPASCVLGCLWPLAGFFKC